jgi:hypothetical protein
MTHDLPSPLRRAPIRRAILGVAMSLAACGGAAVDGSDIAAACEKSTNMGPAICDCLGRKANQDLSGDERAFVVAALTENEAETTRLRSELSLESAMKAGMFMTNVGSCAVASPDSTSS